MTINYKIVSYVAACLIAVVLVFGMASAYNSGYEKAKAEGELVIEQLKLSNAEAIINAQNKAQEEYDAKIKALTADLAAARDLNDERMRQLSKFSRADRDLEACTSDRKRLSELAVRGEDLLYRADAYLRAVIEHEK